LPGRNWTKAELSFHRRGAERIALKDYGGRPWLLRQTVGRLLVRREARAYRQAGPAPGLAPFLGRVGPFALATRWLDARPLAEQAEGAVPARIFDELERIVRGLHARGVALADLGHRDVLLSGGAVHVVDLALACVVGPRSGPLGRFLFERARAADLFAVARLRARYAGEDRQAVVARADPRTRAWHRAARRLKWRLDRWRGAPRRPPTDDHWKPAPLDRAGAARNGAVWLLVLGLAALGRPTREALALGLPPLLAGAALRVWAAGHLVKTTVLVTSGPYRFTRHPLYLGRLLIFTGLALLSRLPGGAHWFVLGAGLAVFFGYYLPRKERVEPARLRQVHGAAYERYHRAVPALLPRRTPWAQGAAGRWSARRFLANREWLFQAALAAVVGWLISHGGTAP